MTLYWKAVRVHCFLWNCDIGVFRLLRNTHVKSKLTLIMSMNVGPMMVSNDTVVTKVLASGVLPERKRSFVPMLPDIFWFVHSSFFFIICLFVSRFDIIQL